MILRSVMFHNSGVTDSQPVYQEARVALMTAGGAEEGLGQL